MPATIKNQIQETIVEQEAFQTSRKTSSDAKQGRTDGFPTKQNLWSLEPGTEIQQNQIKTEA